MARVSLRWKITGTIAAGGLVVAVLAAGGFCALNLQQFWRNTTSQTEALGNIVAGQVPPAMALNDPKTANETLAALRGGQIIRDAVLYDVHGACFAAFHRNPTNGCPPLPAAGIASRQDAIVVTSPVAADGERLGTLVLVAEVPSILSVLRQFLGGAALIILLSCLVAVVAGMGLQSRIATPILAIAEVAQRIAQTHYYTERVSDNHTGELNVLARSFNSMLDEIGRRDSQLAQQQRDLEEQVTERNRVNAELRTAKEKAEEAARLKTEFLANMSHEIRTPMNGVVGMISLVLDQTANPSQREQLQVAHSSAQSLITILNDILDLSKIEAGKLNIETIDFDLRATARESVRMFEIVACEKGLELTLTVDAGCAAFVRGDAIRLRQVLINLVGNAVKFTREGGVQVEIRPIADDRLRFEVRDTGIGVPPEKLNTIFEPFTQADGSHTRQFGGTGLGLTITRRLVNLMGGSVWAESQVGVGSTFYVDLRLPAGVAVPREGLNGPATVPPPSRPLNVLVAEDNPVNQKVVGAMLRRQGHQVTLATNGEEAYRHYLSRGFDLVLMDVQMPEVDGLQATGLIRGEEARRGAQASHVPILALTAHASVAQHDQCMAAGMDGVLTKPIDLASLANAIAEAMADTETAPRV